MAETRELDGTAATVCLLCGPNGRYTSGQTIHINGAWYVTIA